MFQHVTPSVATWCLSGCSPSASSPQNSPGLVAPHILPAWILGNQCFTHQTTRETYIQKGIPDQVHAAFLACSCFSSYATPLYPWVAGDGALWMTVPRISLSMALWAKPGFLLISSHFLNTDFQAVRSQDFSNNSNFLNFLFQFRKNAYNSKNVKVYACVKLLFSLLWQNAWKSNLRKNQLILVHDSSLSPSWRGWPNWSLIS